MVIVQRNADGSFSQIIPQGRQQILTDLNGVKAPLEVVLHPSWTPEEKAAFGVYELNVAAPADMKWTGGFVTDESGIPAPEYLPLDLEEARAEVNAAIGQAFRANLSAGYGHDFGSVGFHRLDLRTADDKANWMLLLTKTTMMIDNGLAEAGVSLRTAGNAVVTVTAAQAAQAMQSMLAWGEANYGHKWALEAQVATAKSIAELREVQATEGWP